MSFGTKLLATTFNECGKYFLNASSNFSKKLFKTSIASYQTSISSRLHNQSHPNLLTGDKIIQRANYSSFRLFSRPILPNFSQLHENLLTPKNIVPSLSFQRSVIKWSKKRGKRVTEIDIIKRFKRLDWGIWIRPRAGYAKKLWQKKTKRINRLKQNVFCNATQSRRLDKMVTSYWRKPRVYANDPLEHYYQRENYGPTSMKPR